MRQNSLSSVVEPDLQPEKAHNPETESQGSSCSARVRAHLGHKFLLLFTVPVAIYVPYFALQHWSLFAPHEMPAGPLERAIPFQPDAVWAYNSIYFLVVLAPFSIRTKPELHRYTRAMLAMGFLANLFFLLWPTTCKRPVLEQPHAAYEMLVAIDAPLHACPSLHAGFSVLSALCLAAALGQSWNRIWSFAVWLWVGVIFYATLATKQHVATDLLAGSVLAIAVFLFVYRRKRNHEGMCES